MIITMTDEMLHNAHKLTWEYIAKHNCEKEDVPLIKTLKKYADRNLLHPKLICATDYECFACASAYQSPYGKPYRQAYRNCNICPIKWTKEEKGKSTICTNEDSLFHKWAYSKGKEELASFYANQIANLPWRKKS